MDGIVIDDEENVYITGTCVNQTGLPRIVTTIKYDSSGSEQWRVEHNAIGIVFGASIAVTFDYQVFVAFCNSSECKIVTQKYDAFGNLRWENTFPQGALNVLATKIAADKNGNAYVTFEAGFNYIIIKYDSSGALQWVSGYNGPGNGHDVPQDIALDDAGNCYVTGYSFGEEFNNDWATIKCDSEGNLLWVERYKRDSTNQDYPFAMTIDNLGNIYVTGYTSSIPGWTTIKYSPDGNELWAKISDANNEEISFDIVTDIYGNIYVTGKTEPPVDYCTIKYGVSDSPLATFPNQGRLIARAANTTDFDWLYQGHDERLIRQWFSEQSIEPEKKYITQGSYPSIAKKESAYPWISYTTGESLSCVIQKSDGTWKKVEVAHADTIGAPSLVLSLYPDPTGDYGDLGYVVYTTASDQTGQRYICFSAFDSVDVYYYIIFDAGNVTSPSIALTPGDYLHVVWQNEDRIYYVTTLEPVYPQTIRQGQEPIWSEKVPVSRPVEPTTEPASNPFIEAQGEFIYAVWRGPNEDPDPKYGEIWQRKGELRPGQLPWWFDPENMSRSRLRESNFPTMSTGTAVVWQESTQTNYEIYGNINGDTVNLSQTANNSFYPHTNLLPSPPFSSEDWRLFYIWTEETIPQTFYRAKYDDYYFSPPDTNIWPLSISGGDSTPSPYCLERDGLIQFEQMAIDYDSSGLVYKLPYLHPKKHYLLEAIAYQETSGVYRQNFTLGTRSFEVRLRRAIPETLRVIIPSGFYDSTFLILRINRLQGNFASLAKLRLYEFEIPQRENGGPQSSRAEELSLKTHLFSPFPNPFSSGLRIRYQLSKAGRVLLKVYDISGREIRVLANENKEPGIYTVNFDSKDELGIRLPFGVYFIRLITEDCSDSKKVVLTR